MNISATNTFLFFLPAVLLMASISLGNFMQYAVLAILGYILVGAPLSTIFTSSPSPRSAPRSQLSFDQVESLVVPDSGLQCRDHAYRVHIFSREPLVIYIENFVSEQEAKHVITMRYVSISGVVRRAVYG